MKKALTLSIFLTGFIAMASQIIYVRELLVIFYGNELSIAFILASWLVGGAIGSSVLGRLADIIKPKLAVFVSCLLALSILLPLNIVAIRSLKVLLGLNPGEIMPFFPMAVSSFIILAPTCMIFGFMFTLACRVYEEGSGLGAVKIGKVYVLEAIGAMAGGFITSFVLVRLLSSLQIMAVFSLFAVGAAITLLFFARSSRYRTLLLAAGAALLIIEAALWPSGGWGRLEAYSLGRQWQGYELVASENSIYGNIGIVKKAGQISFFDNGLHLYTVPDKEAAEGAVHFALLEHPDPKEVLLIGGGVGGLMEEIARHPAERIDYIELDPLIVKMARRYLPESYCAALEDSRVSTKFEDGRLFIKTTPRTYDVIIVSLGDPYTAQLNRFYTAEFFNEAKRVLKKGGVLSFGLSSSESYMSGELRDFLRSIYATLQASFKDIKIIPGETAYFLATDEEGLLTYDYSILMDRAKGRRLDLKYVREYYLFSRLSPQKISYTENAVKDTGRININRDFKPVSYYYDIIFWSTRFKNSAFSKVLKNATAPAIWSAAACFYALVLALGLTGKRRLKKTAMLAVLANGFSQMTFQVVALLAFQIIYGYVFYKLGLMLTAFMAGLSIGGWCIIKIMPSLKKDRLALIIVMAGLCIYPAILPGLFKWLSGASAGMMPWVGSNIVFTLLPVISGFMGGVLFPVANKIYIGKEEGVGRSAGLSYGMDLFGSCLGALLAGTFLIPVLGIPKACLAAALLNLAVILPLVLSREVRG